MKIADLIWAVRKTEDEMATFRLQVKLARYKLAIKKRKVPVRLVVSEG